ncbi:MAG: MATE family efflux transporter [Clostridiales bacterium]|nr:MATE family efflux transporter [Clostridiales bacterium]
MNRDLTVGNSRKVLWCFVLPMLISVAFQQMYNIADTVIVGQMSGNGEDGVAAIGTSYPVTMIFMAVAIGVNAGCSVIISQLFGAKKYGDMKTAIYTSFISVLVLSAIFLAVGLPITKPILKLLDTPPEIFSDSLSYLNIFILAFPFLFIYNVATGIFTAIGDSRTPLYFLIGSSLGNIALDLLFVGVFHWGVSGAAWATFVAQGIAMAGTIIVLLFRFRIWREYKCRKFSVAMLKKISIIAIPSILQQSFVSVGNLFIQSLVNRNGTAVVAGYTAASKVNIFAVNCFVTLSNGVSNFTAQNYGIGDKSRIKQGFKWGCILSLIIALPFFLIFFIFPSFAVKLFMTEVSEEALTAGRHFLMFVSPFYFIICLKLISDGVLRGTVKVWCFLISTFSDLLLRVGFAYILEGPAGLQSDGIWLSWPVGWTLSTVLSLILYFSGIWSRKLNKTD